MIRRYLIVAVLLFVQTILSFASVDSLINLIPSLSKKEKAKVFNDIGIAYRKTMDYNKALKYFQDALKLSKKLEDYDNELEALKGVCDIMMLTSSFEKALDYATQLEVLAEQQNNMYYLACSYANIASINGLAMNDISRSREFMYKSIDIFKKIDAKGNLIAMYNNLAITYMDEENYSESIVHYQNALQLAKEIQENKDIKLIKNNLAGAYLHNKQYDLAYQYNKEALSMDPEAIYNPQAALYDHLLLSMIQLKKGQLDLALENAIRGGVLADSIKDFPRLNWSYESQMDIYKKKGDYKHATAVAEKAIALKDSLNAATIVSKLAEKEVEIKQLQRDQGMLELEKRTQRKLFIRNGILISIIAALGFLFLLYKRNRLLVKLQKRELDYLNFLTQVEEKEKKALEQKLSHNARALASKSVHIIQKNEALVDLKNSISNLEYAKSNTKIKSKINKLNRAIDNSINFDNEWKKFKLHFTEVHPNFFEKLKQGYPSLNNNDIRLCAYIKMGLSTKEIAQLLRVNPTSIQKARYRLKKKMELEKATDLIEFINQNI